MGLLYGAFVWARRALNRAFRRFPAGDRDAEALSGFELARGESVIKCQYSSRRAQSQLWSYVYLNTFSGYLYVMPDPPRAGFVVEMTALVCAAAGIDGATTVRACAARRVISDCHFRRTATEFDRKPGIKWLSGTAK
jgi:hypothetical protein